MRKLRELALFSGGGGGLLGSILSGFDTLCAVEIDPYCIDVPRGLESAVTGAQSAFFEGSHGWNLANSHREQIWEQPRGRIRSKRKGATEFRIPSWWDIPRFARVDDGGSYRLDIEQASANLEVEGVAEKPRDRNARVRMTGNMQVPAVFAAAWDILRG